MIPPIVKFITRYAKPSLYNEGRELAVPCPYHDRGRDLGKKLWVNVQKRVFICYKCDEKGSFRKLLAKFREVKPQAFADVPQDVLDALSTPTAALQGPVEHPGYTATLPDEFEPLWGKEPADPTGKKALKYLTGRHLDADTIEIYRLGYCKYGEYAYRIIIPTYEEGRLVYWLGRDFTGKQDLKVKNPSKIHAGVGSKEWLFNMNLAEDFRNLVICEGVFDAMSAGLNAIALFGKTASEIQISKIRRHPFKTITVLLDADADRAGASLAWSLARSLPEQRPEIRQAHLPEGDPNSVAPEVVKEAIKAATVVKEF